MTKDYALMVFALSEEDTRRTHKLVQTGWSDNGQREYGRVLRKEGIMGCIVFPLKYVEALTPGPYEFGNRVFVDVIS